MENNISKLLSFFELTEKEKSISEKLFEHYGTGLTIKELSISTKIPRGTLHDTLKSLCQKKLVKKLPKYKTLYKIITLDEITTLLEERYTNSKLQLDFFNNHKEELVQKDQLVYNQPHISYNEGIEHYQSNYSGSLQTKEKVIRAIIPETKMVKILGMDFLNNFLKIRIRRGITMKVLTNKEHMNTQSVIKPSKEELRDTRILPNKYAFSSTILIFDNSVNFFTLTNEVISVQIESKEYAETMKSLFDNLWDKNAD